MKKTVLFFIVLSLFASCTKTEEEKVYTPEEVTRIIDSANTATYYKLKKEADKDLNIRKEIELRQIMDSLENKK